MRSMETHDDTGTETRTVAPVVSGRKLGEAPDGRVTSTNPAGTDDAVARVFLGDAGTFVKACRAAKRAQREWAAVPAPIRSQIAKKVGPIVENNEQALARLVAREIGKPYTESLDEVNARRFRGRNGAGMPSTNNSTSDVKAHPPFGGNGRSGSGGRLSGVWVLDQFTRRRSMNWYDADKLQEAQMDVADLPTDPDFNLDE